MLEILEAPPHALTLFLFVSQACAWAPCASAGMGLWGLTQTQASSGSTLPRYVHEGKKGCDMGTWGYNLVEMKPVLYATMCLALTPNCVSHQPWAGPGPRYRAPCACTPPGAIKLPGNINSMPVIAQPRLANPLLGI